MARQRQATWENLGTAITTATSIEDALHQASLDFTVTKTPLYAELNNQSILIPNKKATVRTDTNEPLGVVSNDYEVCQNVEAFNFVNYISNDLRFEKAGITKAGLVYVITKLPDVQILNDSFTPYLIFQNSFNGLASLKAAISPLRIVCQNQFAISFANAANTITLKHTSTLQGRLQTAREAFAETNTYMQRMSQEAERLALKPYTQAQFSRFVENLLPINIDMSDKQQERIMKARADLLNAYIVDDNQNFRGTAWGAMNAISDYLTHKEPLRHTEISDEKSFMTVTFAPQLLQQFYNSVAL